MTGIDSFTNPAELGVLYPFRGIEVVLVLLAVALWVGWHVVQIRKENKEYRDALQLYRRVGMERALHFGGGGDIATEEDIEKAEQEEQELATGERGEPEPV